MAANVIVDASFLVTLLSRREAHHKWADRQAVRYPPPWKTCDAVLSEAFHLLGSAAALTALIHRKSVVPSFHFDEAAETVLALMEKYVDVPMSFADACLVRMTEILSDPILLTTDSDFRIYRRNGRQVVPCVLPR
jgi:predicted nucleic acid-binding protein